jgi:hypothetical protein
VPSLFLCNSFIAASSYRKNERKEERNQLNKHNNTNEGKESKQVSKMLIGTPFTKKPH